ncbi:peptide deformylase [Oceanivirga miroungae]|uniref:Peptide deformylase n=1 Tax=Oceanivirga miroungae TaxID=1130046 RepID=A0A6I8M7U7_9FUSO|nr:peptide deformylase [Oceanivirga miroungae]VWL85477.1 peptide deformylase [Oceanivirga miroungae]
MDLQIYGSKVLREKSTSLIDNEINDELKAVLDDMVRVMRLANGIGLASNQVDINRRYFVMEIDDVIRKCINPEIVEVLSKEDVPMDEGCLSVPGIYKEVRRPDKIKVKYLNEDGVEVVEVLEGLWAKCFQHELDHINGFLFIDRISNINKNLIRKKLALLKRNSKPITY